MILTWVFVWIIGKIGAAETRLPDPRTLLETFDVCKLHGLHMIAMSFQASFQHQILLASTASESQYEFD